MQAVWGKKCSELFVVKEVISTAGLLPACCGAVSSCTLALVILGAVCWDLSVYLFRE